MSAHNEAGCVGVFRPVLEAGGGRVVPPSLVCPLCGALVDVRPMGGAAERHGVVS